MVLPQARATSDLTCTFDLGVAATDGGGVRRVRLAPAAQPRRVRLDGAGRAHQRGHRRGRRRPAHRPAGSRRRPTPNSHVGGPQIWESGTTWPRCGPGALRCSRSSRDPGEHRGRARRLPRRAGPSAPPARGALRPPLPQPRRAVRRPPPGRHDRPHQGRSTASTPSAGWSSRRTPPRRSSARSSGTSATAAGRSGSPGGCRSCGSSITSATAELTQEHGRSPTVSELAARSGCRDEEIIEGLESSNAYSTLSLDAPRLQRRQRSVDDRRHRRGRRGARARREPRDDQAAARGSRPPREAHPDAAVLPRDDPVADRRRDRHLADARVAAPRAAPSSGCATSLDESA